MIDYRYLIIGGGMAGDAAARGIREHDPNGTIGLISAEPHPPYDRPPLSKGLWQGGAVSDIWRDTEELGVTLHLARLVTRIDRAARTVTDHDGEEYRYERLLLATGGSPRRLGVRDDGVIYYRTLEDYERLRGLTAEPRRVLVIGGGYIGAELAAALTVNGHRVEMVFPEAALLDRLLPRDLARHLSAAYRARGVTLHSGRGVRAVTARPGGGSNVELTDGTALTADVVVAGLGITPDTRLAEAAGLAVADGIVVNAYLRTDDERIFAAGDVASLPFPPLGRRGRSEHEENANLSGFYAGQNMAGERVRYEHLPSFYSDLFDIGFEGVGRVGSDLQTVAEWVVPLEQGAVYYLAEGRLQGALLWNQKGRLDEVRGLIGERWEPRPERA